MNKKYYCFRCGSPWTRTHGCSNPNCYSDYNSQKPKEPKPMIVINTHDKYVLATNKGMIMTSHERDSLIGEAKKRMAKLALMGNDIPDYYILELSMIMKPNINEFFQDFPVGIIDLTAHSDVNKEPNGDNNG